jgi:hypothetical protein
MNHVLKPGDVLKVGYWTYDGLIRCRVEIQYADIRYGTTDYEDPPEIADDLPGQWFTVSFALPTDPHNCPPPHGGCWRTLEEAVSAAESGLRAHDLVWES